MAEDEQLSPSAKADGEIEWQVQVVDWMETQTWASLDKACYQALEVAFSSRLTCQSHIDISLAPCGYPNHSIRITPTGATQKNTRTGTVRDVRRVVVTFG